MASPLMLDMTEDAVILTDRRNVLRVALDDIRGRLQRLGSRRVWVGTQWYWDLKPDYRRGDTFEQTVRSAVQVVAANDMVPG